MRGMEITERLMNFNLTRQEATLYLLLLKAGRLTGYEAAKQTGISRSNTYTALAGLVEKGAAYIMEEGKVTRYTPVAPEEFCNTPVAPEEFCNNKIRRLTEQRDELLKELPGVQNEAEGYITIKGNAEIISKLQNTVLNAQARIYVSASAAVMELLRSELETALSRGLKVVIITGHDFQLPGAICYNTVKQSAQIRLIADSHTVLTGDLSAQIRLIADSHTVLTGDLDDGDNSTCLYSCKRNLVDLFKDALKNEIKLIELQKGE